MKAMIVETFPVGSFQCNCTILGDPATGKAIVVDPGDEPDVILGHLQRLGLEAVYAFHTHAHLDHVMATRRVKEEHGAAILLHQGDLMLYENLQMQAKLFGMKTGDPLPVDEFVEDGDSVRTGALNGKVIHTPGHTPGSMCLHLSEANLLLAGDTLFMRGIGRTDLWGGSYPEIQASIRDRLYSLPPATRVIAGHGADTTIGAEKTENPFVRA